MVVGIAFRNVEGGDYVVDGMHECIGGCGGAETHNSKVGGVET